MEEIIDIFQSDLVPEHVVLGPAEKEELIKKFNISLKQLPRIKKDDPVVALLKAEKGDVIRIKRNDPITGEYYYYRVVV
jgi:DNA-directed RNA polymerase subunit H (RpoH/RPB5)